MRALLPAALACCLVSTGAFAKAEPRTADAVISKDNAWSAAEDKGDSAFVEHLLLPGYRSIGGDGKVTTREAIVDHTKSHKNDPAEAAKSDVWRAAHPSRSEVLIVGDTAVLTSIATNVAEARVRSCDVFTYVDGEWRAIYSQHAAL